MKPNKDKVQKEEDSKRSSIRNMTYEEHRQFIQEMMMEGRE